MSLLDKGLLEAPVAEIAASLTGIDRAMVIASGAGTTHERIGTIETIETEGDWISFGGASHASRFDAALIQRVTFDRTGGMKDRIIPRVEFRDAEDQVVFQVSVLSGLEDFDQALAAVWPFAKAPEADQDAAPETAAEAAAEKPVPMSEEELQQDISWAVLQEAVDSGRSTRISYTKDGFAQSWQGVITALRPAMGFINVMTPDFHLHLKGASVASWRILEGKAQALGADGTPLGLEITEVPA